MLILNIDASICRFEKVRKVLIYFYKEFTRIERFYYRGKKLRPRIGGPYVYIKRNTKPNQCRMMRKINPLQTLLIIVNHRSTQLLNLL